MKNEKGFTLIEFLLVMSVFAVLAAIATVNLFNFQRQSQLNSTLNTFTADIKQQQTRAMSGDGATVAGADNYGLLIDNTNHQYVLFKGTYSALNTENFAISVPNSVQLSTTFPSSQLVFTRGSGEISGYGSGTSTITLTDTGNGDRRVLHFNKFGVISSITR